MCCSKDVFSEAMKTERKSIKDWLVFIHAGSVLNCVPLVLHSTSSSMFPLIRMKVDEITVIPCSAEEVEVGDVVLIEVPHMPAGYLLHRLIKKKGSMLRTIGDANLSPDAWVDASHLLGRAIMICGPDKKIDCTSKAFKRHGRWVVKLYRLRPVFFIFIRLKKGLIRLLRLRAC